jgi:hypothetical protein
VLTGLAGGGRVGVPGADGEPPAPFTLFQMASLSSCSGALSTSERFVSADRAAIGDVAVLSSSSRWAGVTAV